MKQNLLERVCIALIKKGFTVKCLTRTCFDIVARKQSEILLIKVLEDANSISQEYSFEMQKVSTFINASPLIISEKAGSKLEDNVVYQRHGIFTVNMHTFMRSLDYHKEKKKVTPLDKFLVALLVLGFFFMIVGAYFASFYNIPRSCQEFCNEMGYEGLLEWGVCITNKDTQKFGAGACDEERFFSQPFKWIEEDSCCCACEKLF